ncbi:MAG: Na+/H+ antiporter NhaA [Myxococcota bacterium]
MSRDRELAPPEAWGPFVRLARLAGRPLEQFLHIEAASGILLLLAAALALGLANSPWGPSFAAFWQAPLGIDVGGLRFERSLEWVVNDGLMVIFFFVVGMEIRREIHHGELSEVRRAVLPAAAALGGMLVPAGIYLSTAGGPSTRAGWGVPMATDIAFAVGILTILGKRVPAALRVLLLALAVIDDLGAIVVIAFFYSSGVAWHGLLIAGAGFLGIVLMTRFGIRERLAYVVPAVVAWAGIYVAGVHPTIAGVIVGLMTPVRVWYGPGGFLERVQPELVRIARHGSDPDAAHEVAASLRRVAKAGREAMSPAEGLIAALHPWVAFGIMPIFALCNAGVSLEGGGLAGDPGRVILAVTLGLVLGKPLGVFLASWLALRLGVGSLPAGLSLRHLVVLGVVAGVGFTMALFVAQLAFREPHLLAGAKLGVLCASGVAAALSLGLGRLLLKEGQPKEAAATADEAERSTEA